MISPVEIEIEIALHAQEKKYEVDLHFDRSDSEADTAPIRGETGLDLEALRALSDDRTEYGKALYQDVFADPKIRSGFENGCAVAEASEMPVRARLLIDQNAPELHALCWEALRDPKNGELLVTRERFLFSRFLSADDWRPVRFRARDEFRALVAIANPSNIGDYKPGGRPLPPLDVPGETKRATDGLGKIPSLVLSATGSASFNGILSKLREGYDILFLVCHGALIEGEPRLCLEDESGKAAIVPGTDLVTRLSELKQRPRLVVLASCQSAGSGADGQSTDDGVLAALGPRLAQAGIPAVIAMQGNVTMRTVGTFMPIFFRELQSRRTNRSRRGGGTRRRARLGRLVDAGALHLFKEGTYPLVHARFHGRERQGFRALAFAREQHSPKSLHAHCRLRHAGIFRRIVPRHRAPMGHDIQLSDGGKRPGTTAHGRAISGG